MGFLDVLLGRTRSPVPDLPVLFRIPGAAMTLREATGFAPTGTGAVCVRAAEGAAAERAWTDIRDLLRLDPGTDVRFVADEFGCTWVSCHRDDGDLTTLTTQLHGVNTTLDEAGLGTSLLCTVTGFVSNPVDGAQRRLGLVHLFSRGTVYPFAPTAGRQRDTALELQVRALLGSALPIEPDLGRWFPLWGAPVP
ncbi:PspA-associated protein PspAB [Pseudonocardia sp. GCM10023141]|uniref:PspA-associated protein PspAB n=1 Tax=Pseudonocardia sp. GCM10023141 TaxID=3252653 RepID=UPI00362180C2